MNNAVQRRCNKKRQRAMCYGQKHGKFKSHIDNESDGHEGEQARMARKLCRKSIYRTPSPVRFRLSIRLRSCSRVNVSGVEVGGGAAAAGGAEAQCWSGFGFGFAETEAGTKDIMVVAGLGADARGAFAGLGCLGPGL